MTGKRIPKEMEKLFNLVSLALRNVIRYDKAQHSYCLRDTREMKMLIGTEGAEDEKEWLVYLEESRESRLRLASRFYRLPRGLPIIEEKGVSLQDDWLGELEETQRIMNNK